MKVKFFYISYLFISINSIKQINFNFLENNLKLQEQKINYKKQLINIVFNNLNFNYNFFNKSLLLIPDLKIESIDMVYFSQEQSKKCIELYNKLIYYKYLLNLISEEILFLEKKIINLKKLLVIVNYNLINEIEFTKSKLLKKQLEYKTTLNNIDNIKNQLYTKYNITKLDAIKFIVPILTFNKSNIVKYVCKSFFIQNDFYQLIDSFNNYYSLGKIKFSFANNNFSINYDSDLVQNSTKVKYLEINKFKQKLLQNILYIIFNLNYIYILKEKYKILEKHEQFIQKLINKIKEKEFQNVDNIIKYYKYEEYYFQLKKQKLYNYYDRVQNIWLLYMTLIPLNFSNQIYELNYNI